MEFHGCESEPLLRGDVESDVFMAHRQISEEKRNQNVDPPFSKVAINVY